MNEVYFGKEGLTATSANHVANMAKEYAERLAAKVKTLRLYRKKARLLIDGSEAIIERPIDTLDIIPEVIQEVAKCNALIGWLREAIKERDKEQEYVQHGTFSNWVNENNIVVPVAPEPPEEVEPIEKVGQEMLNVKENNRYIELKTKLAVYGKFIHPNGLLTKATKELETRMANPTEVNGEGRDMVVYTYEISADTDVRLNKLFFQLQSEYRALQAEINGIEHRFRIETEKEYIKRISEYKEKYAMYSAAKKDYDAETSRLRVQYSEWQVKREEEINAMRIVIPNDLQGIYAKVNEL